MPRALRAPSVACFFVLAGCSLFSPLDGLEGTPSENAQGGPDAANNRDGTTAPLDAMVLPDATTNDSDAFADAGPDTPAETGMGDADSATETGTDAADAGPLSYKSAVLEDNPLAYWRLGDPFVDAGTPEIVDEMANLHPCSYRGTPGLGSASLLVSDPNPSAAMSVGNGFFCGPIHLFAGTAPMTLEVWVKVTGTLGHIVGRYTGHSFSINSTNGLVFRRRDSDGASDFIARPAGLALGTTYHLVGTYDGANLKLYVNFDGVNAAAVPVPSSRSLSNTSNSGYNNFEFGHGTSTGFVGLVDEVAVYDYALPESRIRAHYLAGTTP